MADQNKLYTLTLNEEQIKIVAWETKKYHEQLLLGGDVDKMPLPILVLAQGYESVYKLCNDILADKMIVNNTEEEPSKDTETTTDPEEPDTGGEETETPNTGEETEEPKEDEWVRPEEYKDSPLTDDEIKELLGWLGQ